MRHDVGKLVGGLPEFLDRRLHTRDDVVAVERLFDEIDRPLRTASTAVAMSPSAT